MKAIRAKDAKDDVREGFEEHKIVKTLLAELDGMKPEDEQFEAKMTVLQESVEHHADEEESEMFKEARKGLSKERLEELGEKMEARKGELVPAE